MQVGDDKIESCDRSLGSSRAARTASKWRRALGPSVTKARRKLEIRWCLGCTEARFWRLFWRRCFAIFERVVMQEMFFAFASSAW